MTPEQMAEAKKVLDAVVDYEMAEIRKKMELHGVDFDLALQMQLAVIEAEGKPMKGRK